LSSTHLQHQFGHGRPRVHRLDREGDPAGDKTQSDNKLHYPEEQRSLSSTEQNPNRTAGHFRRIATASAALPGWPADVMFNLFKIRTYDTCVKNNLII
jgi:hypothetical protein